VREIFRIWDKKIFSGSTENGYGIGEEPQEERPWGSEDLLEANAILQAEADSRGSSENSQPSRARRNSGREKSADPHPKAGGSKGNGERSGSGAKQCIAD
jgi:hypothetical protein